MVYAPIINIGGTDYNLKDAEARNIASFKQDHNQMFCPELGGNSLQESFIVDDDNHTMTLKAGLYVWTGKAVPATVIVASDHTVDLPAGGKVFLILDNDEIKLYSCTNGAYGAIDADVRDKILIQIAVTNNSKGVAWTIPYKFEKLSDDVRELSDNVSFLNETVLSDYYLINEAGTEPPSGATTAGLSVQKRWFLKDPIKKKSRIESVECYVDFDGASFYGNVYIEFWQKTGSTLTRTKQRRLNISGATDNAVYSEELNEIVDANTYVAFVGNGTGNIVSFSYAAANKLLYVNDNDLLTSHILVSAISEQPNFMPRISVNYIQESGNSMKSRNVLFVGPDEVFKTIQNAIDSITDDSADNPYTIMVMPSGTPYGRFSLVRKLSDPYPWSTRARYVSIIGLDKTNCVIKDDSGSYEDPCSEIVTTGIIKNLTFIQTHNNHDINASKGAYCIHIDAQYGNDAPWTMVVEDCDFINDCGPCIGAGLRKDGTLIFRRCSFKTTLAADYMPYYGYTNLSYAGCFFAHSANDDVSNQFLELDDCVGVCFEGSRSLYLKSTSVYTPGSGKFKYRLINNVFWNETAGAPSYDLDSALTAEPMNFGNNIPNS